MNNKHFITLVSMHITIISLVRGLHFHLHAYGSWKYHAHSCNNLRYCMLTRVIRYIYYTILYYIIYSTLPWKQYKNNMASWHISPAGIQGIIGIHPLNLQLWGQIPTNCPLHTIHSLLWYTQLVCMPCKLGYVSMQTGRVSNTHSEHTQESDMFLL